MALRTIAILSLLVSTAFAYKKIGEYMPVSNVLEHSQINLDVALFNKALKGETPDYTAAKAIYENGGGNSCKSPTKGRSLKGFAEKDLTGESYADAFYASGLSKTFWHDWFMAGLDGTGPWKDLNRTQRTVSLMKGAMGLVTFYAAHELEAALVKAKTEETRTDAKAGHAWDEGWAFYYGTDGVAAPIEVAKKRDADFPDGVAVETGIVSYFNKGLVGVRKDTYDLEDATTNMNVIYKMWLVTYMRAALKYLQVTEKGYGNGKAHAEGYAYWMAIAGFVANKCKDHAKAMTDALAITQSSIPAGTFCKTKKLIEECYVQLGISCEMVGKYKDAEEKGVVCKEECVNSPVSIPKGAAAVAAVDGTVGDDVKCGPGDAPAPAPAGGDAPAPAGGDAPAPAGDDKKATTAAPAAPAPGTSVDSATASTVGIATLAFGIFMQM